MDGAGGTGVGRQGSQDRNGFKRAIHRGWVDEAVLVYRERRRKRRWDIVSRDERVSVGEFHVEGRSVTLGL